MHLASDFDLEVPAHGLFRSTDDTWVYLVRRFDRLSDGTKLSMEDMGQALGILTRDKYDFSYEKIAKGVLTFCTHPYLELTRLFERLLFCFAIGNGDMHLKNFSFLTEVDRTIRLAPVYDYLSSKLLIPREEDLALYLNGKKNKIKRRDFEMFSQQNGLDTKVVSNILERLFSRKQSFLERIEKSFLPEKEKDVLGKIIQERISRLQ
ncbi:MAG: HipA domain-containing protein [Deltaproteobacteria bacterium]|nr:MAG: HipA domain-containing protein [Deltaproteobacteria bacterium]